MDPAVGVIVGIGIGSFILYLFKGRKNQKALKNGVCPQCKNKLKDKKFSTGFTAKICPEKHGYFAGDGTWVKAKELKKSVKKYIDKNQDEIPNNMLVMWHMYHTINSDTEIDSSAVTIEYNKSTEDIGDLDGDDLSSDYDGGGDCDCGD